MNSKMRDVILDTVAGMRGEKKVAEANEAAYAAGFRKAAGLVGVDPVVLSKQAQLKLLAGAARAADVRKALAAGKAILPSSAAGVRETLAAGKAILPSAPSLKKLILDRVAGLRGQRSLGWPLPAYPGRAGRAKGLLDYEDHLWGTGAWGKTMRDGEALRLYEARLLRQLNGDRSALGRQLSDALHAAKRQHKPVGLDLAPLVAKKKAEDANEAAYAAGFRKAVGPVQTTRLMGKQAFAVGDAVSLGLKAWKGLRGVGSAAARATRNPRQTLAAAKGAGSRYLELLRGGNTKAMAPVRVIGDSAAGTVSALGGGGFSQGFARIGSRYGMAGGAYDPLMRMALRSGGLNRADYANYLRGKGELRKVIGARAVTGGLLGGGARLAVHGGDESQTQGTR